MLDDLSIHILSGKFLIGVLFFFRVMGLFMAAPAFENAAVISPLKVFLAAILAASLTAAFWRDQPTIEFHLWNMVLLVFKEIMIGVAMGFAARAVFFAAKFAGGLIDFDLGYQTSALFNPNDTSPTLAGEMLNLMTLMLFFFLNGHHFLIESLYASAVAVPIDTFVVSDSTVEILVRLSTSIFIIAVKISAPILVAIFIVNLALALLARVAPQTNIFILSFQMKVAVGLVVLFISVPLFVLVAKYSLGIMEEEALKIVLSLNPARV